MSAHDRSTKNSSTNLAWRAVILCAIAQNCAMGLAFGSFGPLLASTEQHFGVSRAVATTGMSMIMLAIGGLSPFLGGLLQRISVRAAMIAGALLSAFGYWGLAFANSFQVALVMFALIGVGVSLTAILGPLTVISRWFETNRGKMLAIVNLPILMFLTPYIAAEALPVYGRFALLGAVGTIFVVLALLLTQLVERPPISAQDAAGSTSRVPGRGDNFASIMKSPAFWLLSLGIGIMAGSGTAFVVHIVPFGMAKQMSLQSAAALLSVYAAAGIAGTLLLGWICDRIGPPTTLLISTLCQALLWWGFLHAEGAPLYLLAALLGICLAPIVTLHGAAISHMFDSASVSRAMGYSFSIKLPFIFAFAPGMGFFFDRLGGYEVPFLITAALLAVAAVFFYAMLRILLRHRPSAAAAAMP